MNAGHFQPVVSRRVTAMVERYRKSQLQAVPPNEAMTIVAEGCVKEYREAMDRFSLDAACRQGEIPLTSLSGQDVRCIKAAAA